MDPMIRGIKIIKFALMSEIIIHFGINPISGGKPPSDRSIIGIRIILFVENDEVSIN